MRNGPYSQIRKEVGNGLPKVTSWGDTSVLQVSLMSKPNKEEDVLLILSSERKLSEVYGPFPDTFIKLLLCLRPCTETIFLVS